MQAKGSDTVPDISNYDYNILDYIHSSEEPVSKDEISVKFGAAGRAAVSNLVSRKLLAVEINGDSILDRDDDSPLKFTDAGLIAHQSYRYDRQLKGKERFKEQATGFILGCLATAIAFLTEEYLWPAILQALSSS